VNAQHCTVRIGQRGQWQCGLIAVGRCTACKVWICETHQQTRHRTHPVEPVP